MPVVLITGASRGLGLEFARQYAADGWEVIATCRNPAAAAALRTLEPRVRVEPMDVTDFAGVRRLARRLENTTIDVLVANAGINIARDMSLAQIDAGAWSETFRVNTMGPLAVAAAFLPHVARSSQRKLAAISSRVGSIGGFAQGGHYVYRSSKAALNAAWRAFAVDHPEIIAVLLSPGLVDTDMTRDTPADRARLRSPAHSVAGLRSVIEGLGPRDTGAFLHCDGERLPW